MNPFKTLGWTGSKQYNGQFYDEWLDDLRGIRGVHVYTEIADNDDVVGAMLFAIKMLIRQASWSVQPASNETRDKKVAEFVESCLNDMQTTWTDTISEILSFLTYGWSLHEICYKRRMGHKKDPRLDSKFDDGLIGWLKLPIRAQESLYQWELDDDEELTAFVQMPAPKFEIIRIPAEKFLLFRTESRKGNPEGRSVLRNAYRSWYFKKKVQELEGIGIERDLAGFPVLISPEGINIWSSENATLFARCQEFISNIRRDAMEGLTIPGGWELKLLSTGGQRQFDTSRIIERYNVAISQTVLADFLFLGHEKTGSWALSSDKTEMFAMAIGAYLDIICEVFNRVAIPRLVELNRKSFAGADYPVLVHSDIETQNLTELSAFLKETVGLGLITPDDALEEYLREQSSLPAKLEDAQ